MLAKLFLQAWKERKYAYSSSTNFNISSEGALYPHLRFKLDLLIIEFKALLHMYIILSKHINDYRLRLNIHCTWC